MKQLGDYSPAWLPDGFEERETVGTPVPEDGWYGYVRRFYTEYESGREIYLSYEPFRIPEDVQQTDSDAYFVQIHTSELRQDVVTEKVTVNGLTGVVRVDPNSNAVYWLDTEHGLMFSVASSTVTVEELQQLAKSVCDSSENKE